MNTNTLWSVWGEITGVMSRAYSEIITQLKTARTDSTMVLFGVGPFDPELQLIHSMAIYPMGVAVDNRSGNEVVKSILDDAVAKIIALTGETAVYTMETLFDEQAPGYVLHVRIIFENSEMYDVAKLANDMIENLDTAPDLGEIPPGFSIDFGELKHFLDEN